MLAIIVLSPVRRWEAVERCGDHAISRGVLGLSFQGPRGARLPAAGSRYLVPVPCGVQRISKTDQLFFSGGISREKKPFLGSLWGHPEESQDGSVRAGPGADFAACRDSRRGGPPSRGAYTWTSSSNRASSFDFSRSILESFPQVVDNWGAIATDDSARNR